MSCCVEGKEVLVVLSTPRLLMLQFYGRLCFPIVCNAKRRVCKSADHHPRVVSSGSEEVKEFAGYLCVSSCCPGQVLSKFLKTCHGISF